jgi:5'-nucleotidase
LYEALKEDHRVVIVAPEWEHSAVGHAITLSRPLRVRDAYRQGFFFGRAVSGTPADCVKIAVQEFLDSPPDVVVSGINAGANLGVNLLYSGTVSAATEGAFLGIPAVAVSLDARNHPDFRFAARFAARVVRFVKEQGLGDGIALNVNIPDRSPDNIKGVRFTRQGTARFEEYFERRNDPRGNAYYWLCGETQLEDPRPNTDLSALREGYISITPIHYDLTAETELRRLEPLKTASLLEGAEPPLE